MRRSLLILLASCAGAEHRPDPPTSAPIAQSPRAAATAADASALVDLYPVGLPDPWAPAPGPSLTGSFASPPPRPPPPDLPATIEMPISDEKRAPATPRGVIGAVPGGISIVAATDDGKVAVTANSLGSVRVWPALDGTREPVVLAMRAPRDLALTRAGADLAIAGTDEIGQLEIVRARATGELVQRAAVPLRRPLVALHATSHGFIGLHDDGAIAVLDTAGALRGELVADPGQHVASLAVRRDRALAIVDTAGGSRGRWIDLEHLRWDGSTPVLPIAAKRVVLSPDHRRVAGMPRSGKAIWIVDVATGKVKARLFRDRFDDPTQRLVGFTDDGALAVIQDERLTVWRAGREHSVDVNGAESEAAIAGGEVIAGSGSGLSISNGSRSEYLGYRSAAPYMLRAGRSGFVVSDGASIVEVDRRLATRKVHEMPTISEKHYRVSPVHLIDDRHAIASAYNGQYGLYLIDLELGRATLIAQQARALAFEPSTGLLAYHGATGIAIVPWQRATRTFGTAIELPDSQRGGANRDVRVVLLDPAVARGNAVALVSMTPSLFTTLTLYRVRGGDTPALEQTKQQQRQLTHEWFDDHHGIDALVPAAMTARARRSPDRKLVAELRDRRITLRDTEGNERWTIADPGAVELVWTPRGELFAFGSGLARIDLASGALRERQCGWRFGRWDMPVHSFGAASLCEAR